MKMAANFFAFVIVGVLTLIVLGLVGAFTVKFILPALDDVFCEPIVPKYTPCVAVSARIDGEMTYRETNLKRIPLGKDFFLKFDVSIRRRWLYRGDEKFAVTIENKEPDKLVMDAIEYSGEKTEPEDTFVIVVSKHTGKNTIVFRCKSPKNGTSDEKEEASSTASATDTLFQITIKSDDARLEPLNKTIALVFASEQSKTNEAESAAAKVSIDGTVTVKIE
ncbi:MAG: hypothetical protein MdMp014T_2995 [Treponematales bacterium]